jgi:cytidylate kinase
VTGLAVALGDAIALGYPPMTAFELATPIVLITALAAVGAWSARRDRRAYERLRRRGVFAAMLLLLPGTLLVGWFIYFDPNTISGIATSPAAQTSWILSMSLFGAGLSMLAGVAAYSLGGWLSGLLQDDRRSKLIIAIDGPAASGKGTLAKRLGEHLGVPYLDTGLLYRAVARDVRATAQSLEDAAAAVAAARALDARSLADPALRGPLAGDAASIVARIPEVRAALLDYQRQFARQSGRGAILDGRDIGTVVCPNADIKIFVTASDEARAHRRHLEHQARGETISYDQVLENLRRRDARDSSRSVAPLEVAHDALVLDTTDLDPDQAFTSVVRMIEEKVEKLPPRRP